MKKTLNRFLLAVLGVSLAFGVAAIDASAAGPTQTGKTVLSEGFEVGSSPTYSVTTLGQPSTAQWASVSRAYAGVKGLWCAGTAGLPADYPVGTFGLAQFELPQLVDYYSSSATFRYVMPTVGAGEKLSGFQVYWERPGGLGISPLVFPPLVSSWNSYTVNLSTGPQALARRSGHVVFKFGDLSDPVGGATTGQGPTIDEVLISAWKYGPPRSLRSSIVDGNVNLTWSKPYRSAVESVVEERSIGYRVWRAPAGTQTWTELTSARLTGASFSQTAPGENQSYRYSVQAWDTATGAGYGVPVDTTVAVPGIPPSVSMAAPAAAFAFTQGVPVVVAGAASDVGTGLDNVKVRIRRADGRCWTGSFWTTTDTWITASSTDSFASWSYSWLPDSEIHTLGQIVTISAKATDRAGLTKTSSAVSSAIPGGKTIALDGGRAFTAQRVVPVTVEAEGATQMRRRVDGGAFGSWVSYATADTVTIPAVDGEHVVEYEFSPGPGGLGSDSIIYDSTAPTVRVAAPASNFAPGSVSSIAGSASDTGSGVESVAVQIRSGGKYWNGSAWQAGAKSLFAASSNGYSSWALGSMPSQGLTAYLPITIELAATDALGTVSPKTVVTSSDPADPTTLAMSLSSTTVGYNASTTVMGTLASQGAALGARDVQLQYYSSGWKTYSTAKTDWAGRVVFSAKPVSKNMTYFRLVFAATGYVTSTTSSVAVTPRPYVGRPTRPSVAYLNRAFTVKATLNPRHSAGSYPVKILCYRYEKGKWVYRKGFYAKAYNYSSYSRVYAKVKLPYRGYWKMRAYAKADSRHAKAYSSYTSSFKVK